VKSRFKYVCAFIGFTNEDIATIKGSVEAVAPLVPTIVDAVYNKLFSFDVTKQYFILRNDQYTSKVENQSGELTINSEQIKFRKDMLSKYLVKLVTAEYDDKFVEYLDHVGKVHTKAKNKHQTIDYIHINALLGYVEDIILNAIMKMKIEDELKTKLVRAFNKLLWIQNDLFARHYIPETKE